MAETKGTGSWVQIQAGWYKRVNSSGKVLAYAERYRSFWNVTIFPMADAARKISLSAAPRTLTEAKSIAEIAYKAQTIRALREQEEVVGK